MNYFDSSLSDQSIYIDPYPIYKKLREQNPICWSEEKKAWVITSHKDIVRGLRSNVIKKNSIQNKLSSQKNEKFLNNFFEQWLLYLNSPTHERIKHEAYKLINREYFEFALNNFKEKSVSIFQNLTTKKRIDIVKDYGQIISMGTLCNFFKIPEEYHRQIFLWALRIIDFMQGRFDDKDVEQSAENACESIISITTVLKKIYFENKENYKKIELSDDEIISVISNVIIDGFEPIVNSISNAIMALSKYPDQYNLLLREPVLEDNVIYELLRFDPPFQYVVRYAGEDIIFDDVVIRENDRILFIVASANHDLELFENGDDLNLFRKIKFHMSFGFGNHFCLGKEIAVEILRIAIDTFMKYNPRPNIQVEYAERQHSLGSRALKELIIMWDF